MLSASVRLLKNLYFYCKFWVNIIRLILLWLMPRFFFCGLDGIAHKYKRLFSYTWLRNSAHINQTSACLPRIYATVLYFRPLLNTYGRKYFVKSFILCNSDSNSILNLTQATTRTWTFMSRSMTHRMGKEPINMSHHTIAVAVVKTS